MSWSLPGPQRATHTKKKAEGATEVEKWAFFIIKKNLSTHQHMGVHTGVPRKMGIRKRTWPPGRRYTPPSRNFLAPQNVPRGLRNTKVWHQRGETFHVKYLPHGASKRRHLDNHSRAHLRCTALAAAHCPALNTGIVIVRSVPSALASNVPGLK